MNFRKDIFKKRKKQYGYISTLTCYDFTFASIMADTDVDALLVGDSLANVILGLKRTNDVPISEMINHTLAVKTGAPLKPVIADMPFRACHKNPVKAVYYAKKFISKGKADAVKIEWSEHAEKICRAIKAEGIEVMGHVGLTPQTADKIGGFKVQGKDCDRAINLIEQAFLMQEAGAFAIVLECVPADLSRIITDKLDIPTIGIGAGRFCDGQILVYQDMLGMTAGKKLKFVRRYADIAAVTQNAVNSFCRDIRNADFPGEEEGFSININEIKKIKKFIKKTKFSI